MIEAILVEIVGSSRFPKADSRDGPGLLTVNPIQMSEASTEAGGFWNCRFFRDVKLVSLKTRESLKRGVDTASSFHGVISRMNAEYQRLEADAREVEGQIRDLGANVELRSPLDHAKFEQQIAKTRQKVVFIASRPSATPGGAFSRDAKE